MTTITTYYNSWTEEKIEEYIYSRLNASRMVMNTDLCARYDMGGGETYECIYTDHIPGSYPYTENIYINGELAQVSRHI